MNSVDQNINRKLVGNFDIVDDSYTSEHSKKKRERKKKKHREKETKYIFMNTK